jgi:hypothetical protein
MRTDPRSRTDRRNRAVSGAPGRYPVLLVLGLAALFGPASLASCQGEVGAAALPEPTLDDLRRAVDRFRDVDVALAEGYVQDHMCASAEMMGYPAELGAMGIHFFHPGLLGITRLEPRVDGTGTHTDFTRPAILIYEPQPDGRLELVAVENLVFRAAWYGAGNAAPPTFHGKSYDPMEDDPETELDEAHMFEPHYDLHIWLYRQNPRGTYEPFNPAVTCAHYAGGH